MSKIQICRIFWVENGPQNLYHVQGRVFIVEMVSPNLGSIRKFLGNFLMDTLFSQVWTICELPIFNSETQSGRIRKFPGNFLMHPGVSDPGSIRQFPRNFLMDPRKKFKLFADSPTPTPCQPHANPMSAPRQPHASPTTTMPAPRKKF